MDWSLISTIAGVAGALGGGFAFFHRKVLPKVREYRRFIDRVLGIPENHLTGEPELPGLFPTLNAISAHLAEQDKQLEVIRHELFPNSGKSLRDEIDRQGKELRDHIDKCGKQ
jgi:hypothetical protein